MDKCGIHWKPRRKIFLHTWTLNLAGGVALNAQHLLEVFASPSQRDIFLWFLLFYRIEMINLKSTREGISHGSGLLQFAAEGGYKML